MNKAIPVTCAVLAVTASFATAQGGKDVKPIPPEILAKSKSAREAIDRGATFIEKNQLPEAIAAFREAVAIEQTIPGHHSRGYYELAKALTLAERADDALAAYKNAFKWDPIRKDLDINGPSPILLGMDYAILLARSGKEEEAKSLYYRTLRQLMVVRSAHEPFPFLIVFDPDPNMAVWEYTTERFVAVCTMLKAPNSGPDAVAMTEHVRRMEPNWVVPVMYLASRGKRSENLRTAQNLATTDEERAWVRMYTDAIGLGGDVSQVNQRVRDVAASLAAIGVARRKASPVLQQAKLDLEQNWRKVASGALGAIGGSNAKEVAPPRFFLARWS